MAFCASCGSAVEGKFCPKCGTPMAGGVQAAPPPPPSAAPPQSGEIAANVAGTICYIPIFITSIIFLVLAPYNRDKLIRFHAWQSLFLCIAWVILSILLSFVFSFVSWSLYFLLRNVLNLVVILVAVFMMYKTYQNEKVVLPIVGGLAEKQA